MRRIIYILLILSVCNINVHAKGKSDNPYKRVTFGAEWGYVATLQSAFIYSFFSPEGYRMETRGYEFRYISNAEMYAHVGYSFNEKWNLSLYVGYEGIADIHKALPISLRMTRYFGKNPAADRWFMFLDGGSGISLKKNPQEIFTGKLGVGYRLALSRFTSLDFIACGRLTHTHPQIFYDGIPISFDMTNRNIGLTSALSVGMALTF